MLAEAYRRAGRHDEAASLADQALTLARSTGSARHLADALNTAGTCARVQGRWTDAVARHEEASTVAGDSGGRFPEIVSLTGLALAHRDPDRAVAYATRAVVLARQAGFRLLEGRAHVALGDAHGRAVDSRAAEAATCHACRIYRDLGVSAAG